MLAAAEDYSIRIRHSETGIVLGETTDVNIRPGMLESAMVNIRVPVSMSVRVEFPDGTYAMNERGAQVTAYDPLTGQVLGADNNVHRSTPDLHPTSGHPLFSWDAIRLKVGELPPPYKGGQEETVTLDSVSNEIVIKADWLEQSTLKGQVIGVDGRPAAHTQVTVIQEHPFTAGRMFTQREVTDNEGRYSFGVIAGNAELSALHLDNETHVITGVRYEVAALNETYTKDLQLINLSKGQIQLRLKTLYKGGTWQVVDSRDTNWRFFAHLPLTLTGENGRISNKYIGYSSDVFGEPGDEVKVCVNGKEANLPQACTTVTLDDDLQALAEIELIQTGAAVKGNVVLDNGQLPGALQGTLYRVSDNGRSAFQQNIRFNYADIDLWVQETDDYVLHLQEAGGTYQSARINFQVTEGDDVLTIGTVRLRDAGLFAGNEGTDFRILSERIVPGDTVTFRANYHYTGETTVNDVSIAVDIPEGFVVLPDSVLIDGEPAISSVNADGTLVKVDLGSMGAAQEGIVRMSMATDEATPGIDVGGSAQIQYTDQAAVTHHEVIGQAHVSVVGATLQAPAASADHTIFVQGTAPIGSHVDIYAGQTRIDATHTPVSGYWGKTITLPDTGTSKMYRLHIVATDASDRTFTSTETKVFVDPSWPVFTEMSMQQADGSKVAFDPSEGVARFPYVMTPDRPYIFHMRWNQPDRISHVRVRYGDGPGAPTAEAKQLPDGSFRAVMNTTDFPEGDIYVSYDIHINGIPIRNTEEEKIQLLAEIQGDLPEKPELPEIEEETPGSSAEVTVTHGEFLGIPYTLTTTVEEIDIPADSVPFDYIGSEPVYAKDYRASSFQLSASYATMVDTSVAAGQTPASRNKTKEQQVRMAATGGEVAKEVAIKTGIGLLLDKTKLKFFDDVKNLPEPSAEKKRADQLYPELKGKAGGICPPWLNTRVNRMVNDSLDSILRLEITRKATTFIPAPGYAEFVEETMKVAQENEMDWIESYINMQAKVNECEEEPNPVPDDQDQDNDQNEDNTPESADGNNQDREKPTASPEGIYDPSGFVYEALESERIKGVTATVLYLDPDTGEWVVWDAEWYGQQNPQMTDPAGKYGWDVPKGKWQVMYEKEGYITAYSDVLTVLPPHFDVNVSMKSLVAPKVQAVRTLADVSAINVYFDKPMRVKTVGPGSVIVRTDETVPGAGEIIVGTVEPVDKETDAYGQEVSKVIRFTPNAALTMNDSYEITIAGILQSYAGTSLGEDVVQVVVIEADTTAPAEVTDALAIAASEGTLLTWTPPMDVDFAGVRILWRADGETDTQIVNVSTSQSWYLLQGLQPNVAYTVTLTTLDTGGNQSAGVVLSAASLVIENNDAASDDGDNGDDNEADSGDGEDNDAGPDDGDDGDGANPDDQDSGHTSGTGSVYIPSDSNLFDWTLTGTAQQIKAFDGKVQIDIPAGLYEQGDRLYIETVTDTEALDFIMPEHYKRYSHFYRIYVKKQTSNAVTVSSADLSAVQLSIMIDAELEEGFDVRKLSVYHLPFEESVRGGTWQYQGGITDHGVVHHKQTDGITEGYYAIATYHRSFADLTGHWSQGDVDVLISRHMIHGVNDNEFQPNRDITRAEMAQLIVAALGLNEMTEGGSQVIDPFEDVAKKDWYAEPIRIAYEQGIISGYRGKFRPNDVVSREEMAVMLTRAFDLDIERLSDQSQVPLSWSNLTDSDAISPWAIDALFTLYTQGLISGIDETRIAPSESATRAQATVMMVRLLAYTRQW